MSSSLNKQLFLNLFNNVVIRNLIVDRIHWIHQDKLSCESIFNWNELLKIPALLIKLNYTQYLYQSHLLIKRPTSDQLLFMLSESVIANRIDIFQYIIDQLPNIHSDLCLGLKNLKLREVVWNIAEYGRLEFLKLLCRYCPDFINRKMLIDMFVYTSKSGNLNMLRWIFRKIGGKQFIPKKTFEITFDNTAGNGFLPCVIWLSRFIPRNDPNALTSAIVEMQYHVAEWLISKGLNVSQQDIIYLAANEQYSLLKVIFERYERESNFLRENYDEIAAYGNLDTMKQLRKLGGYFTSEALRNASKAGNIEILDWLVKELRHREYIINYDYIIDDAVEHGNLETVKWIHNNLTQCQFTENPMVDAIKLNRLDILQWLHSNTTIGLNKSGMDLAAINNNLEMIKWLHEHRTGGYTGYAIDNAARSNNMDIVLWLHSNTNEGFTIESFVWATQNNNIELLNWFIYHKESIKPLQPNFVVPYDDLIDIAIQHNHFDMFKFILDCSTKEDNNTKNHNNNSNSKINKLKFKKIIIRCYSPSNYKIIEYLIVEKGVEVDEDILLCSIGGEIKRFKILLNHFKKERFSIDIMEEIALRGQLDLFKYVYEQRIDVRNWSSSVFKTVFKQKRCDFILWLLEHPSPNCKFTATMSEQSSNNISAYFKMYIQNPTETLHSLLVKDYEFTHKIDYIFK